MLFNSFNFLLFFPAVVLVYFLIPQKVRYLWLLGTSYYFYMCWNPKYVLLLLFSTAVTFLGGLAIERFAAKKAFLAGTIAANLAVLFVFKYFDFALSNLNFLLERFSVNAIEPSFSLLLPVGISFYTFQALGYTIDVYRKDINAEKNFFRYALFVSFFPQLVAGPIERSKNLLKQVGEAHSFDYLRIRKGLLIMLWGYFLKLVIADRVAIFVNAVYGDYTVYGGLYIVAATLLFAVQIYCDFAGYSTIARGAALVLGFRLMENFEAPYFAGSVAEFWRRWHISLSGWFRDYLYIPLGGNRKGNFRKQVNLLAVFLVSGLWHGASWNYVIWGGLNGLYQIVGMWKDKAKTRLSVRLAKKAGKAETEEDRRKIRLNGIKQERAETEEADRKESAWKGRYGKHAGRALLTFALVDFSWIFFRADSVGDAFAMIKSIFSLGRMNGTASLTGNAAGSLTAFKDGIFTLGLNKYHFLFLLLCIAVLWITDLLKYRNADMFAWIEKQSVIVRYGIYLCLFCAVVLFGIYGVDYEASQFIYFQF